MALHVCLWLSLWAVYGALGYQSYQAAIPNGANVMVDGSPWPGVGHDNRAGAGARNPFGQDFKAAALTWTQDLCQKDSDADGQTNGEELGDPSCVWVPGATPERTTSITNPGISDSTASGTGTTVYSGYLIDNYCFALMGMGRLALDGTNVITAPWEHTIHCLRDPPQCYQNGFYLAINNASSTETPNYMIKFQLDSTGNANALALLRQTPVGSAEDNTPGNYRVTATGQVSTARTNVLAGATLVRCTGSISECDGVCSGPGCGSTDTSTNTTTGTGTGTGTTSLIISPRTLLWAHVILMVLSWGMLLPLGVVWARGLRLSAKQLGGQPIWFQGHRIIQSLGWALQLAGFACVVALKNGAHFREPHEILGLTVTIIGSLQPINAQLRHLKCIGHQYPDGSKTAGRHAWEWLHKGLGYAAVAMGIANIFVGHVFAKDFGFGDGLPEFALIFTCISLGILLVATIILEIRRLRQPRQSQPMMPPPAVPMIAHSTPADVPDAKS